MASESTQFVGAHKLSVRVSINHGQNGLGPPGNPGIAYFPDGQRMISTSGDETARVWDLQSGKEIEKERVVCDQEVYAVVVSRNDLWVVTAAGDPFRGPSELKAHEVKTDVVKTYECHSGTYCIDISANSKLLVSGSYDGTLRIWSLDSGKLVAGPIGSCHELEVIRFSHDSRKLATIGRNCIDVWDVEGQKLDVRIKRDAGSRMTGVPILWTREDRTIVVAHNSSDDRDYKTICELDASTLQTVRTPFKGHTDLINNLALSFDCTLLVSASYSDDVIKLWAFESRQALASFNSGCQLYQGTLILSPDARQIAYRVDEHHTPKIYVCDIPPDVLINIPPTQEPNINSPKNPHIRDPLNYDATTRLTVRSNQVPASFVTQPSRYPPPIPQERSFILRHLRKFLPSSFHKDMPPLPSAANPPDPLDYPAVLRLPNHLSPLSASGTPAEPSNPRENLRPTQARPISQSPGSASTPTRFRIRSISNWWQNSYAPAPIVSVPFAQGQERNAAAGAPRGSDDYVRVEDLDSRPPSPSTNAQRAPESVQGTSGEHGSGWLCFCS